MNRGKKPANLTNPKKSRGKGGKGQSSSTQPQTNRQSQYYPQQPSVPEMPFQFASSQIGTRWSVDANDGTRTKKSDLKFFSEPHDHLFELNKTIMLDMKRDITKRWGGDFVISRIFGFLGFLLVFLVFI